MVGQLERTAFPSSGVQGYSWAGESVENQGECGGHEVIARIIFPLAF